MLQFLVGGGGFNSEMPNATVSIDDESYSQVPICTELILDSGQQGGAFTIKTVLSNYPPGRFLLLLFRIS